MLLENEAVHICRFQFEYKCRFHFEAVYKFIELQFECHFRKLLSTSFGDVFDIAAAAVNVEGGAI